LSGAVAHNTQPLILSLETSQREASVALRDRAGRVHAEPLSQRKRHDDDLLPAIDRMFARAGLSAENLRSGAVCVSIGPGGFTGLRIAVATAKMLAETLEARLVGVPSALVAAESQRSEIRGQRSEKRMLIALACKGETFWLTRVAREAASGEWRIVGEPGIAHAESFDLAGVGAVLADEHLPEAAARRVASANIPIIAPSFTATACLRIGEGMLARGETIDPLRLLPLYSREPEAVTLWRARESRT
jgi:tRNA threonylcarbamoyladenosine biosynthesis protein TsaB